MICIGQNNGDSHLERVKGNKQRVWKQTAEDCESETVLREWETGEANTHSR